MTPERSDLGNSDAEAIGRALAARHAEGVEPEPDLSLANYAERPRSGDWSMRAAVTRFAQPEALRSSQLLTLVRRLDAALHIAGKALARTAVMCDRAISPATLNGPPTAPYPDVRIADLARLEAGDPAGFWAVLSAYEAHTTTPLDDAEHAALALLGVALRLDALAETLTSWASRGPHDPPIAEVDATCAEVRAALDALAVPEEEGPPPGRRGRGV